jgi:two-component system response regulator DevR
MTQNETKPIRLLLVDDHEIVRLGLRTLFSRYPNIEVVGEAGTVAGAVAETAKLRPDVVLMDVRLPDGTGLEACRQISQLELETHLLILTSYADDELVHEAIFVGAEGYVLKEFNGEGLVRAIEDVAAGKAILDPAVTRRVFARYKSLAESGEGGAKDKIAQLSPQERRVLALVAEGKTNKEIGVGLGLSDKTIKNYLKNLMDKLQLSRRAQAAAFFVQHQAK